MNRNNSSGIFVDVESAEQSLNPILENDIELMTNLNHDDTSENDLNQIIDNINNIMKRARVFNNSDMLQEFRDQLETIKHTNIDEFCLGYEIVGENIVENENADEIDSTFTSLNAVKKHSATILKGKLFLIMV